MISQSSSASCATKRRSVNRAAVVSIKRDLIICKCMMNESIFSHRVFVYREEQNKKPVLSSTFTYYRQLLLMVIHLA